MTQLTLLLNVPCETATEETQGHSWNLNQMMKSFSNSSQINDRLHLHRVYLAVDNDGEETVRLTL